MSRLLRRRFLAVIGAGLCAVGGAAVAFAGPGAGGDDPGLFTYDTILGETVPIAYDAYLRSIYISPTAQEGTGTVPLDQGLTPATDESAADLQAETALPQPYPPEIDRVSLTADANARAPIYPPDVIDATTAYDVFDGTTGTTVWAGGIASDPSTGVFLKTVGTMGSGEGQPQTLHLSGTGPITLTRFVGDDLFFTTASGKVGVYHIGAGTADLFADRRRNVRAGA